MTKDFKIGEYAIGGIIRVVNFDTLIIISALDFNTKKVVRENCFDIGDSSILSLIDNYLNDLTTSYYTDKIITYLKALNLL